MATKKAEEPQRTDRPWNFACGCRAKGRALMPLTLIEACAGHAPLLAAAHQEGRESGRAEMVTEAVDWLARRDGMQDFAHVMMCDLSDRIRALSPGGVEAGEDDPRGLPQVDVEETTLNDGRRCVVLRFDGVEPPIVMPVGAATRLGRRLARLRGGDRG